LTKQWKILGKLLSLGLEIKDKTPTVQPTKAKFWGNIEYEIYELFRARVTKNKER